MGAVQFKVDTQRFKRDMDRLDKKMRFAGKGAEHVLAMQMAKDTEPYVPALTGEFSNRTQVNEDTIIYPGPFARYLYHGKVMVDASGRGPMVLTDKMGNKIVRFPTGSILHPTERDLVFTKSFHPKAQSHWFEASKAQNLPKWKRVAGRLMQREFRR